MFDRIARRYDVLNRILSLRLDVRWRRVAARMLPTAQDQARVLDLATGTGDMLLAVFRENPHVRYVVGMDMSLEMLTRCRQKIAASRMSRPAPLIRGDACTIAARAGAFDAVTMAFGIRNVPDVLAALREARRVLRPNGRLLILEFSLPRQPWRAPYLFYLRHVLTRVGGWISGEGAAYAYLNRTIESFPCGEAFCQLMREAGFSSVCATPLTFGIATIYEGVR